MNRTDVQFSDNQLDLFRQASHTQSHTVRTIFISIRESEERDFLSPLRNHTEWYHGEYHYETCVRQTRTPTGSLPYMVNPVPLRVVYILSDGVPPALLKEHDIYCRTLILISLL